VPFEVRTNFRAKLAACAQYLVTLAVVLKGFGISLHVFKRLARHVVKPGTILFRHFRAFQLISNLVDKGLIQLQSLYISESEIRLDKAWKNL
jgi:hypothetical protein